MRKLRCVLDLQQHLSSSEPRVQGSGAAILMGRSQRRTSPFPPTPGCTEWPGKGDSMRLIHLHTGDNRPRLSTLWALRRLSKWPNVLMQLDITYVQRSILCWLTVVVIKRSVLVRYMITDERSYTGLSGRVHRFREFAFLSLHTRTCFSWTVTKLICAKTRQDWVPENIFLYNEDVIMNLWT